MRRSRGTEDNCDGVLTSYIVSIYSEVRSPPHMLCRTFKSTLKNTSAKNKREEEREQRGVREKCDAKINYIN